MRAAVESFAAALPEFRRLTPDHHRTVGTFPDQFPLDFNESYYCALETAGILLFVGLRDHGELVGYLTAFIMRNRYARALTLYGDLVYVHPAKRGRFGFRRLWRVAAREALRRGVRLSIVEATVFDPDVARLWELMGFRQTGTVYAKVM